MAGPTRVASNMLLARVKADPRVACTWPVCESNPTVVDLGNSKTVCEGP